jgi:hypothetical protein
MPRDIFLSNNVCWGYSPTKLKLSGTAKIFDMINAGFQGIAGDICYVFVFGDVVDKLHKLISLKNLGDPV